MELLFKKTNNPFYELSESSKIDANIYGQKMICPKNQKDLKLQGHFNASKATNLMLVFEKCDKSWSKQECKSDSEIADWMLFKYIAVLQNQKLFIKHKFD